MEARELKDMTAVLRSINDGNPSNAERWVNLTQRVIRAEYRANTAERAAARKDWERQNAEDDAWMARCRAEEAKLAGNRKPLAMDYCGHGHCAGTGRCLWHPPSE